MTNFNEEMVEPIQVVSDGLWNFLSCKKDFTITCGWCSHTFTAKVGIEGGEGEVSCPRCQTLNRWSLEKWLRGYDKAFEAGEKEFEMP